jgi:hypothetical protein
MIQSSPYTLSWTYLHNLTTSPPLNIPQHFFTPSVLHHSTTATYFALLTKKIATLQTVPPPGRKVDFAVETGARLLHFPDLQVLAVEPAVLQVGNRSAVLVGEYSPERLWLASMILNILDPTRLEGCSLRVERLISSSVLIVLQLPLFPPWTLAGLTTLIATVATVRAH